MKCLCGCLCSRDRPTGLRRISSSLGGFINDGIGGRYWELQTGRVWMEEVHGHGYVLGAISCPGPYPYSPSVFCFLDMKSNLCHISCHHGFFSDHKGPSDHGLKPWAKGNPPSWVVSVRDLVTAKRKGTNWGSTSNLCSVYTAVGDNLFLCSWLDLPELFLFIYFFRTIY